jgi:hypothetical protein
MISEVTWRPGTEDVPRSDYEWDQVHHLYVPDCLNLSRRQVKRAIKLCALSQHCHGPWDDLSMADWYLGGLIVRPIKECWLSEPENGRYFRFSCHRCVE